MNDLTDTLPDLMRRATEDLEPESADLVERSMRRGVVLRRRRTVLRSAAGSVAVLATATGVFAVPQVLDRNAGATVAGSPATSTVVTTANPPAQKVTPRETVQTLKKLLPAGLRVSKPEQWGDVFIGVSVVVDDGNGDSHVEASVQTLKVDRGCANEPPTVNCRVRPDGSVITSYQSRMPTTYKNRSPRPVDAGVIINSVTISHPDRRTISVSSTNAPALKRVQHTRPLPILSVAQLTRIADSPLWKFPPASYGKDVGR